MRRRPNGGHLNKLVLPAVMLIAELVGGEEALARAGVWFN